MTFDMKVRLPLVLLTSLLAMRGAAAAGFELLVVNGQSVATDASAVVFNPAGLARLERAQVIASPIFVSGSFEFEADARNTVTGSDGGDAADSFDFSGVLFYARKVSPKLGVGLGFSQPFGGSVDYSDDWKGRFIVQEADFESYALTGSLGYQVNESLSLGAGVWGVYGEFEEKLAVDTPGFADGQASIDTDDTVFGIQVGALWTPGPATKVGVSYRSQMDFELGGALDVTLAPGAPGRTLGLSTELPAPQSVIASLFQGLSPKTAITVDLGWYDFSSFDVTAIDTSGGGGLTIPRNWKDAWRFGLGVQHQLAPQWGLQLGATYGSSPVNDSDRLPDLPADRQIRASVGLLYVLSEALQIPFGYTYLDLGDNSIDITEPGGGRLAGEYDPHRVQVFSFGVIYNF